MAPLGGGAIGANERCEANLISTPRVKPWLRIAIEMAVIVISILLAFGIDAWWARGQERKSVAEYRHLLSVQMSANRLMLQSEVEDSERDQEGLGAAIRAISPNPSPISADSLWSLLQPGWGLGTQTVEVSALESLLSLASFDPTEDPVLYRHMIAFRGRTDRLEDNVDRFVVARGRTSDYIRSVSPPPALLPPDPDSGEVFLVPIDQLLRDPQLESLLKELHGRHNLRERWARELSTLADSILMALQGGS